MKTVILKCEVPDDFPDEMAIYSCEINGREDKNYHEYDRFFSCDDAEIIHLPTDEEKFKKIEELISMHGVDNTRFISQEYGEWLIKILKQ